MGTQYTIRLEMVFHQGEVGLWENTPMTHPTHGATYLPRSTLVIRDWIGVLEGGVSLGDVRGVYPIQTDGDVVTLNWLGVPSEIASDVAALAHDLLLSSLPFVRHAAFGQRDETAPEEYAWVSLLEYDGVQLTKGLAWPSWSRLVSTAS